MKCLFISSKLILELNITNDSSDLLKRGFCFIIIKTTAILKQHQSLNFSSCELCFLNFYATGDFELQIFQLKYCDVPAGGVSHVAKVYSTHNNNHLRALHKKKLSKS